MVLWRGCDCTWCVHCCDRVQTLQKKLINAHQNKELATWLTYGGSRSSSKEEQFIRSFSSRVTGGTWHTFPSFQLFGGDLALINLVDRAERKDFGFLSKCLMLMRSGNLRRLLRRMQILKWVSVRRPTTQTGFRGCCSYSFWPYVLVHTQREKGFSLVNQRVTCIRFSSTENRS